jgi:hypothetical protein
VFIYAFSRAIYRELAEEIIEQPQSDAHIDHERVLRACEAAVQRLATDRRYFARPVRSLFCDIRMYFSDVLSGARAAGDRAFPGAR